MEMRKLVIFFFIAIVIQSAASAEGATPELTKKELQAIDRIIKSVEDCNPKRRGGNACEAEGQRIYLTGAVGYRGKDCVAVQFTIEAGNADYQYLLVLERPTLKRYGPLRIGGRGYRQIEIWKIENGLIHAKVRWYGPNDSLPVPSVPGEASFDIDFGGLIERYAIVGQ
ncbi:MAG: hypothetical protein LUQ65_08510 [Candidatus Helarchaeota archaeon]|nr:hypothetical protein [Candidatus Helarchaeota archaeon]